MKQIEAILAYMAVCLTLLNWRDANICWHALYPQVNVTATWKKRKSRYNVKKQLNKQKNWATTLIVKWGRSNQKEGEANALNRYKVNFNINKIRLLWGLNLKFVCFVILNCFVFVFVIKSWLVSLTFLF